MISAFSWQNSVSLCPASFLNSKAKFACYSKYLLTSDFCIPVPYNENEICFGCQFQKVLQVFIEPFNFSFFRVTGWGIDLDYCDIEWFSQKQTEIILLFLRLYPSTAFQTLLFPMMAIPVLLRDSCPQLQIQWSSELKPPIPVHFS